MSAGVFVVYSVVVIIIYLCMIVYLQYLFLYSTISIDSFI